VQSAGDPEQNGAVPIHIPRCANASLVSKIAVTAKTILNRIIEALPICDRCGGLP
jgi:hypothetical protein